MRKSKPETQESLGPEIAAAIRMLRAALPREFVVEPEGDGATAVRIEGPSIDPVHVSVGSAGDEVESGHLLVLPRSSTGERDALRQEGVSFIDLSSGVVCLREKGLYVDRNDIAPVRVSSSAIEKADPYSDRASKVVRILLTASQARAWTTSGLAKAADVDVSTASRVVRELQRRELVVDEAPGQGRASKIRVIDPGALLGDWTRRYAWVDNPALRVAAPVGAPSKFIARMPELLGNVRWALSMQAGASLIAPHADFDAVHVYVDVPVESLAFARGWEPSPAGKLVLMEPSYTESVWFQAQDLEDVSVVSPLQLVLDLWHYRVRGREQAEHLVDSVLRPIWEHDEES